MRDFTFVASSKFQAFEIDHVEKMLAFSLNFAELLQRNNEQTRSAQTEFNNKLKSMTGSDILDAFVEQKKTGSDRPGRSIRSFVLVSLISLSVVLQFEDVDHLKNSIPIISTELLTTNSDEINSTNPSDFNLPSFQAHFSVPSPNIRPNDINRSKYERTTRALFVCSPYSENSLRHHHFFHGLYERSITTMGEKKKREKEKHQSHVF